MVKPVEEEKEDDDDYYDEEQDEISGDENVMPSDRLHERRISAN